jgi:hypothetical protein
MITQDRLGLGSWNLIGRLIMTSRWPLLIFRSLGQRSRSRWPEIVKCFPDDYSRTLMARIMKLHRYIDHDWQMTPNDFQSLGQRSRSQWQKTYSHNGCHYNGEPIWGAFMFYKQPLFMIGLSNIQTVKISTSGFSITISCILGRFMAILMVNQALKFEHFFVHFMNFSFFN